MAAEWTSEIEFGPMVSPLTWHPPSVLAREAAAVDVLSGGRLILGIGAGWNVEEHNRFGLVLPPVKERMDNYESDIERILRAWELSEPHPSRGNRVPLLLGGRGGEKRGLRIVARFADEWNLTDANAEIYQHKFRIFLEHCHVVDRDPNSIRRSTLHGYLVGANDKEVLERAAMLGQLMPGISGLEPREVVRSLEPLWFIGTPDRIADQMKPFINLGVELFMVEHWLQDDSDALKLLAEVVPQIA